ncbi:hypothetical protein [Geodermatophilus sp. SYSU D00710]
MLTLTTTWTVPVDRQVADAVRPHPTPFPVARTIGDETPDRRLHLLDGDGASLCEAFPPQQLERMRRPWEDVDAAARCHPCELLGSPSAGTPPGCG